MPNGNPPDVPQVVRDITTLLETNYLGIDPAANTPDYVATTQDLLQPLINEVRDTPLTTNEMTNLVAGRNPAADRTPILFGPDTRVILKINDVELNAYIVEVHREGGIYNTHVELIVEEAELQRAVRQANRDNYPNLRDTAAAYANDEARVIQSFFRAEMNREPIIRRIMPPTQVTAEDLNAQPLTPVIVRDMEPVATYETVPPEHVELPPENAIGSLNPEDSMLGHGNIEGDIDTPAPNDIRGRILRDGVVRNIGELNQITRTPLTVTPVTDTIFPVFREEIGVGVRNTNEIRAANFTGTFAGWAGVTGFVANGNN